MSVLYCTIPDFFSSLARRDDPSLAGNPLILVGPDGRILDASAEAVASGIEAGMATRMAQIRCPEARLVEADPVRCQAEAEILLQVLEKASPRVEPHGWGAAYVELGDPRACSQAKAGDPSGRAAQAATRPRHRAGCSRPGPNPDRSGAISLCREIGQAVRCELGEALQPALGWNSSKFTAQAAARRTPAGHLRAVDAVQERDFLQPLSVRLLPLAGEALQRLCFLGLRTLGQYAALSPAAVWQQFGRAGKVAHCCARGEDDRPVIPRWQAPCLAAAVELEAPLVEQERLVVEMGRLVSPLLAELRGNLQACGRVRLEVRFEDSSVQAGERTFLLPVAEEGRVKRTLEQLLVGLRWQAAATGLAVTLAQIQDALAEQLTLFPLEAENTKLREVPRYLATRFGASHLRRAVLAQPGAPLPEWRVGWLPEGDP